MFPISHPDRRHGRSHWRGNSLDVCRGYHEAELASPAETPHSGSSRDRGDWDGPVCVT
jgi:hypothetical protein